MSVLVDTQRQFVIMIGGLISFATAHGYALRFGDAERSTDPLSCPDCGKAHTYQELLFFSGRSKISNAALDPHSNRLAVDFVIERLDGQPMQMSDYDQLGTYWEAQGGRWGGRFGVAPEYYQDTLGWDAGHFELKVAL